ncbi:MAG TPA: HAD-IC family P-type ATPase, partial [Turneriella sp.]|nr:HAD-IC family P-type ATPase [Turneriella sp.]
MDLATDSNATIGLSTQIVSAHRAKFGFNEIPEKRASNILRVAQKFWNLSAWMLEAIALLSWFLGRTTDFIVALSLLIVNALISVVQERRAEGVVESLRARLRVEARVLRDGVWQVLPARELVPGDVVRLRMGDFVPADSRILTGALLVDQSALTGESHAIEATTDAVVYSGSMVRRGEATCRVNATGRRTYFGKTIELVDIAKPRLHIESIVARLVRWLFLITGILALL